MTLELPYGRAFLEEGRTAPLYRVTSENLRMIYENFLRKSDRRPVGDLVRFLEKKGYYSYLGGSVIERKLFHRKEGYNDIDMLAIYLEDNEDVKTLIPLLRERSGRISEFSEFYTGQTNFLIKKEPKSGGYLDGPVEDRFKLFPVKIPESKRKIGNPSVIDLSFQKGILG